MSLWYALQRVFGHQHTSFFGDESLHSISFGQTSWIVSSEIAYFSSHWYYVQRFRNRLSPRNFLHQIALAAATSPHLPPSHIPAPPARNTIPMSTRTAVHLDPVDAAGAYPDSSLQTATTLHSVRCKLVRTISSLGIFTCCATRRRIQTLTVSSDPSSPRITHLSNPKRQGTCLVPKLHPSSDQGTRHGSETIPVSWLPRGSIIRLLASYPRHPSPPVASFASFASLLPAAPVPSGSARRSVSTSALLSSPFLENPPSQPSKPITHHSHPLPRSLTPPRGPPF